MRKVIVTALLAAVALTLGASAGHGTGSSNRSGGCGPGGALQVIALTKDQRLLCFRRFNPAGARTIGTVSGLQTDTALIGVDHRPADGKLYGAGDRGGVYTIDPATAAATLVSRLNIAGVPVVPSGVSFGVDFNPAADRLRIVSDNGQNLRANVVDGSTNQDTALNYTAGTPTPGIGGAMYTNNDADPNTGTTLFDVDSALDQLSIQSPPNTGGLVPTGKLGVDTGVEIGADIDSDLKNGSTIRNTAYLALNVGGTSQFLEIDVLTTKIKARGAFALGTTVIGIAVPLGQ